MSDLEKWSEKYNEVVSNPPQTGEVLAAIEGNAVLTVELNAGSPPFIYGRTFVPEIIDLEVKWYLQGTEHTSYHGWKCILMPRARAALIQKCGLAGETIEVKSLKVVRSSQTGKSLLCEVHEYAEEEKVSEEEKEE